MTTPIFPTKTILKETKYTPQEIFQDRLVEEFFLDREFPKRAEFLTKLMQVYRAGESTSLSHTFDDYYSASQAAQYAEQYGYTVLTAPVSPNGRNLQISWA